MALSVSADGSYRGGEDLGVGVYLYMCVIVQIGFVSGHSDKTNLLGTKELE
jgi:hypothetical protein